MNLVHCKVTYFTDLSSCVHTPTRKHASIKFSMSLGSAYMYVLTLVVILIDGDGISNDGVISM